MPDQETKKGPFLLKVLIFIGLASLILIVSSLLKETYKKNRIRKEIETLEAQAKEIDRENFEIQERLAYLESEAYKKKEAKEKLGLQDPGESVVFIKSKIIEQIENTNVSEEKDFSLKTERVSEIPNFLKWWRYFFDQKSL